MSQLGFYALHVQPDLIHGQEVALLALHRRIADHARTAAGKHHRPVSKALKPGQAHQRDQMAYMEAVGSRVKSHVRRDHLRIKQLLKSFFIAHPVDKSAFTQDSKRITSQSNQFLSG